MSVTAPSPQSNLTTVKRNIVEYLYALSQNAGPVDPLAGVPLDLAFLTRRYPDSAELYGCYSDDGVTTPSAFDGEVAAWRDDARSLEVAFQTTGVERPIARLVDGVPMLELTGATPTTLVSNSFDTAGKAVIFVIKRDGGEMRLFGDFDGLINLNNGITQLIGPPDTVQSENFTEFQLECIRIQRTASGNTFYHNGNIVEPNGGDTLGTANAPLQNIGGFSGSFFTGYLGALVICDESVGEAAELGVRQIFGLNDHTNPQVVCLGDSLTLGIGSTDLEHAYPGLLQAARPTFDISNMGISGDTVANMLATSKNRINRAKFGPNRSRNIVVVWAGTNDIVNGATGSDTYDDLVSLCNLLSAYGYEVIVGNTIARNADATFQAEKAIYNNLINTTWNTFASALADLAARPELSDFSDLTYYNVDGVHLVDAGYVVVEDVVDLAIGTIL